MRVPNQLFERQHITGQASRLGTGSYAPAQKSDWPRRAHEVKTTE